MEDPESPSETPRFSPLRSVLLGALLAAVGFGVWYQLVRPPEPSDEVPAEVPPPGPPPEMPTETPAQQPPEVDADESPSTSGAPTHPDALLRAIAAKGSASADLAQWLLGEGVFRRVAVAVKSIADGRSPRGELSFIKIAGKFSVVESWDPRAREAGLLPDGVSESDKDRIFFDRAAYGRYDTVAQIFATADVETWGASYSSLRPHFDRVFEEIAEPGERFDEPLKKALSRLTRIEVAEGQPELIEDGAIFRFKDPALESLGEGEKHLVRMGAKNARAVQAALRRFAQAAKLPLD